MWIRARLQDQLSQLGYFLQRHAGKVLFLAIVALATFCVALKSAQVHSKVEQLWVQGKCVIEVFPPNETTLFILYVLGSFIESRLLSRHYYRVRNYCPGKLFRDSRVESLLSLSVELSNRMFIKIRSVYLIHVILVTSRIRISESKLSTNNNEQYNKSELLIVFNHQLLNEIGIEL